MMTTGSRPTPSPVLRRLFYGWLPVAAFELFGPGKEEWLPGDEAVAVERATPMRQREFAAGRACAHRALNEIGVEARVLPRLATGAPAWPDRAIGSISHTRGYCCAVAALSTGEPLSIGIDVEQPSAVGQNLEPMLFGETERAWLAAYAEVERSVVATLAFSAKEAFYKAQFPLTHTWLKFLDVRAEPASDGFILYPVTPSALAVAIEWPTIVRATTRGKFSVTAAIARRSQQ